MSTLSHPHPARPNYIRRFNCGDEFPFSDCPTRVAGLSYGQVDYDEVKNGEAFPIGVTATGDGRTYVAQWHDLSTDGLEHGEAVYCERWEMVDGRAARVFHGWIDSLSRKIVQAG